MKKTSSGVFTPGKISIRLFGRVWFKLCETERHSSPLLFSPGWTWVMAVWGQTDVWAQVRSHRLFNPPVFWCSVSGNIITQDSALLGPFPFLLLSLNNQSRSESLYWYFTLFVLTKAWKEKQRISTPTDKLFPIHFLSRLKGDGSLPPHRTGITQMPLYYLFLQGKQNNYMVVKQLYCSKWKTYLCTLA